MYYHNRHLSCPGKLFYGFAPDVKNMYRLNCVERVDVVWNLLDECPAILQKEKIVFPTVLHSPIADFSVPKNGSRFVYNLEEVCLLLESGKNVFVHCLGGRGRTGMAMAAILVKINKISVDEALILTYEICRGPELDIQKSFIQKVFSLYRYA